MLDAPPGKRALIEDAIAQPLNPFIPEDFSDDSLF